MTDNKKLINSIALLEINNSPKLNSINSKELQNKIEHIEKNIRDQYLEDNTPWVVAFSGGKDSTATLQLIFSALETLPKEKISKEIHVLSNDTLVENPKVIDFLNKQLEAIEIAGKEKLFSHAPNLFTVKKSVPELGDRFWLSIIGKGYPSPNRWFRWCTERMKINPSNQYILDTVDKHGKAIVILGTRKDESTNRAATMKQYKIYGMNLHKHSTLNNAYVFAPISEISNEEVWLYLRDYPSYWGENNQELMQLYYNSFDVLDCPLVIDLTTPSCGNSRFGCWTCTVVDEDKSMKGMILNGEEWMNPLLNFRNWLKTIRDDETKRMNRGRDGSDRLGPFTIDTRKEILERLLKIENEIKHDFISKEELTAIQLQWSYDGFFNYNVAEIYESVRGINIMLTENSASKRRQEEYEILDEVCRENSVNPDHIKTLMQLERERMVYLRRRNLLSDMQQKIKIFVKDTEPG